jgi:hypothetical protein
MIGKESNQRGFGFFNLFYVPQGMNGTRQQHLVTIHCAHDRM